MHVKTKENCDEWQGTSSYFRENDKEWNIRKKKIQGGEKGGQAQGMSDGSRSEGAEKEKIGDLGRREEAARGQRWKDD